MIGVNIELDRADLIKIDKVLARLGQKVGRRRVMKALRRGAKPLVLSAKRNAPVSGKKSYFTAHSHVSKGAQSTRLVLHKPGELKRSIGVIAGKDRWSLYVGPRFGDAMKANDAWYAHFVEFGTSSTGWGKGIPESPYMRPAWDETYNEVVKEISNELSKAVMEL